MASSQNGGASTSTSSTSASNLVMSEEGRSNDVVFNNSEFQPLKSHIATILTIIVHFLLGCLLIPLNWYINALKITYPPMELAALVNIIVYFYTIVMTILIQYDFERAYERGYADLYRITARLIRAPFFWFSIGNTLMLFFISLYYYMHDDDESIHGVFKMEIYYISFQIIVVVEVLISLYHYVLLTGIIIRHNSSKRKPDVLFNNIEPSRALDNELSTTKKMVGYGILSTAQDHLIQSQNDQIDFLKHRSAKLLQAIRCIIRELPPHLRTKCRELLANNLSNDNNPAGGHVGAINGDLNDDGDDDVALNVADDDPLIRA